MVTPKLKSIASTTFDLLNYVPVNEDFCLSLDLLIGPADEDGMELFCLSVCSPRFVERFVEQERIAILRGYMVVDGFQLEAIRARIVKLLSGISGETWSDVAAKLSRYFRWEYEEYPSSTK
jgi:hypothetical protein